MTDVQPQTEDSGPVFDMYTRLDKSPAPLARCPVCAGKAALWQFQKSPGASASKVVMCEHGESIGPQDGIAFEGCPMYMPDDGFYKATIREAVKYWNDYAAALVKLRESRLDGD